MRLLATLGIFIHISAAIAAESCFIHVGDGTSNNFDEGGNSHVVHYSYVEIFGADRRVLVSTDKDVCEVSSQMAEALQTTKLICSSYTLTNQ